MKKKLKDLLCTLVLTLAILLSFSACENSPSSEGGAADYGNNITAADPGDSAAVTGQGNDASEASGNNGNQTGTSRNSQLSMLYNLQYNETACVSDNGYYYLSNDIVSLSDGRPAGHLMYMDFAARQEIYLCSNAACSHNTADCTSVLLYEDFPPHFTSLFIWNDGLYIMSKEPDHDGSMSVGVFGSDSANTAESMPAVLYRANMDGTGRSKIYTFDPAVTVEDFVAGDGGGLYFITKKLTTRQSGGNSYQTSSERELVYLDLSTLDVNLVLPMDFNDNVSWEVIGCSGRSLVLYGIDFGRELSPEEKHENDIALYDDSYDVFAMLDVDNGSINEIYRVYAPKAHSFEVDEDKLYFSVVGDGSITSVDLHSGEQTELCRISQDSIWGIIGDKLYTWDSSDHTYYFIDVDTGEISHSGLVNKSLGWSLQIIAETEDQVLAIYDYDATARGDGSYTINRYLYGLIGKEDLYAGIDNFVPIKMIGKGM